MANADGLMTALRFGSADLDANRAGRLSEAQRDRLRAAQRRLVLLGGGLVAALTLAATAALFFGQRGSSVLTVVGIGLTLCNAAVVGVLARDWLRLNADLRADTVAALEGTLSRTVRVGGRVAVYLLRVEGVEIAVPRPVFLAFTDEARYRLYRAPHSRALLSAEQV